MVCIAGFVLLANIILNLFNEKNLTISIVVQAVFGLCGFGLSIFFIKKQKYLKFYMILVGGITGYVIGNTLNNLFISIIDTKHIKLISIIVIVVFIIVGVIFGIFLTKGTFIVGTSIIGSYCLMRAFSFFLYDKWILTFLKEILFKLNEKYYIFTKIRTVLNEREDELLSEVNIFHDKIFDNENIIRENEKLPNKIKLSLEKGKLIENEWNDNNKLSSVINNCINIEDNIKNIKLINDNI